MTLWTHHPAIGDSPDDGYDTLLAGFDLAPDPVTAPVAAPGNPAVPGEPAGFTLARLTVVLVVAIAAARLGGMSVAVGWTLLTAAAMWSIARAASPWTAIFAAVEAWLLGTGFLVDRFGVLGFGADDRLRLAVTVIAVCLAMLVGRYYLSQRAQRAQRSPHA